MCKRWTGSEWETLEDGKKPFAIWTEDGEGPWVQHDRPAVTRTDWYNDLGGDKQDPSSLEREIQPVGWTIDEWINRKRYEKTFRTDDVPAWPLSTMLTGKSLHVSEGVQIIEGHIAAGALPADVLKRLEFEEFKASADRLDSKNCMMHGLTLGRSVSFITAVMCEMLRAYTVRSLQPVYEVWNRNWIMHGACASSFLLTVSLTFIPGVKDLFKLGTPSWFFYGVAFVFALGSMLIDEASKWAFRRVLAKREAGDKGTAERKAIMDQLDLVTLKLSEAEAKNQSTAVGMGRIAELLEKDQGNKINLTI